MFWYSVSSDHPCKTGDQVFISGQIGLVPASMQLPTPFSMESEAVLALQHVDRIALAFQTQIPGGCQLLPQAVLIWVSPGGAMELAKLAWSKYAQVWFPQSIRPHTPTLSHRQQTVIFRPYLCDAKLFLKEDWSKYSWLCTQGGLCKWKTTRKTTMN
jgi:hypothetical protein